MVTEALAILSTRILCGHLTPSSFGDVLAAESKLYERSAIRYQAAVGEMPRLRLGVYQLSENIQWSPARVFATSRISNVRTCIKSAQNKAMVFLVCLAVASQHSIVLPAVSASPT